MEAEHAPSPNREIHCASTPSGKLLEDLQNHGKPVQQNRLPNNTAARHKSDTTNQQSRKWQHTGNQQTNEGMQHAAALTNKHNAAVSAKHWATSDWCHADAI
jgi:hypothetical protein